MTGEGNEGPVADFCAALRRLQQDSGLTRAELSRRIRAKCSRTQLYAVFDGEIRRPPEWDRLVEPLVRACTSGDERAVDYWRSRHGELVKVYDLSRRNRQASTPKPAAAGARVVPAQLPADVDVFAGRGQELAELDRLLTGPVGGGAAGRESTAVVISAVSGTAGVGKTALALRWAHRVRSRRKSGVA